jgi:hypothetical protein
MKTHGLVEGEEELESTQFKADSHQWTQRGAHI